MGELPKELLSSRGNTAMRSATSAKSQGSKLQQQWLQAAPKASRCPFQQLRACSSFETDLIPAMSEWVTPKPTLRSAQQPAARAEVQALHVWLQPWPDKVQPEPT